MTPQELYQKRKFKAFVLRESEFLEILQGKKIVTNFPEGCHQVDCGYLLDIQGFTILVCHDDYPEVPNNERADLIPCKLRGI